MGHARQPNTAGVGATRWIATILTAIALAAGALVGVASPASAVSCNSNFGFFNNANKLWVSAELGYTGDYYGMLRARASSVGPWERFTFCNWGTYYTLQSNANHKYVSAEVGYYGRWNGMLRARADSVGPWERFQKNWVAEPMFDLVSDQNFLYVSADSDTPPPTGNTGCCAHVPARWVTGRCSDREAEYGLTLITPSRPVRPLDGILLIPWLCALDVLSVFDGVVAPPWLRGVRLLSLAESVYATFQPLHLVEVSRVWKVGHPAGRTRVPPTPRIGLSQSARLFPFVGYLR